MFFKEFFYKAQTQTFTSSKLYAWGLGTGGILGAYGVDHSLAQISNGTSHALAVTSDGRLLAWGQNNVGQLGDGTSINKSNPVQIGLSGWKKVSAGNSHSVALRSDGYIFAWGLNSFGQLGIQNTINRSSPVLVSASQSWIDVDGVSETSLAINSDRQLFLWGLNSSGQIGDGTSINKSSPVSVGSGTNWVKVVAGTHTAGVTLTGQLFTWGLNSSGQLGDNTTVNKSSPVLISSSGYRNVSVGNNHTLAVSTTNTLLVWGNNSAGQLGLGNTLNRSSPVQLGVSTYSTIAAGWSFSHAITADGKLFAWGLNANGQLGDNTTINKSNPVQISSGSSFSIVSNSIGAPNTIAALDDRVGYGWGLNTLGIIGNNTVVSRSSPTIIRNNSITNYSTPIQVGNLSWVSVSTGLSHSAAIRSDNLLFAWGFNSTGQLGNSTTTSTSSPVQVGTSSWTTVSAGANYTLAIRSDNTLWAWGTNVGGNLGTIALTNKWKQIGGFPGVTSIAIKEDNTLWGWGGNGNGTIGDGTTINRSSPVQIGTASNWSMVAVTNTTMSAAINDLGELYTWGLNDTGQLGIGNTINRSSPTLVAFANQSWVFTAGTAGITNDGKLYGWGVGNLIGDNTVVNKSNPVQISVGNSFTFVSASAQAKAAIDTLNRLYTWGNNIAGQLAHGDTINRSSPALVTSPITSWSMVSVNNEAVLGLTLAISTTGLLYTVGENRFGQLGNGTTVNRSRFVQVGTSSFAMVTAAASMAAAIDVSGRVFTWGRNLDLLNNIGILGDGTTINRSSPIQILSSDGSFTRTGFPTIASHSDVSFVIRDDGLMYAWGVNASGQLGRNNTNPTSTASPQIIQPSSLNSPNQIGSASNWQQVVAFEDNRAAIDSLGRLYTWGTNTWGQKGNNTTVNRNSPIPVDNNSWASVAVGPSHTLAIRNDGSLYGWGVNGSTQLGNDTTTSVSNPVLINATNSWLAVTAGREHSLALKNDGSLWAWGGSQFGQTGIITDAFRWLEVSYGASHAIAIKEDGTIWTWGLGASGQLGNNSAITVSSPVQVQVSGSFVNIAASADSSAAIRNDGALFTWGIASNLGDPANINRSIPIQIGNSSWSQITVGQFHTLAVDASGRLFGWGTATALNASTVIFSWAMVSENTSHVAAIRSDGLLFAWGLNSSGQIGDGTTINKSSPVQIGNDSWISVSSGQNHTLGVTSTNSLFAWGNNSQFQLGDNTTVSKSSPIQIGNGSWISVTAANSYSMAIDSNNKLYAWGLGASGQLGTLTEPYLWTNVSAGSDTSLAVRNDSTLWGWGINTNAQLGDLSFISKSSPVQVQSTESWATVSSGVDHTLAITTDGKLYGWGLNTSGQTGVSGETYSWVQTAQIYTNGYGIRQDGSLWVWGEYSPLFGLNQPNTAIFSSPVQIGNSSWTFVTGGGYGEQAGLTMGGITVDNRLFTWGYNQFGQLGDNSDAFIRSSPVQVAGSWSQIAIGTGPNLGIRTDGTLWAWGTNSLGELGDGTTITKSSPVQISAGSWKLVAVGITHSVAVRSDDTLWVWGANTAGQLGDGTTVNKSSPVQITNPGAAPWLNIAAGNNYTFAISGLGLGTPFTVYGWGDNSTGQLGINNTSSRSNPVIVKTGAAGASFIQVSTNHETQIQGRFTTALTSNGQIWSWGAGTSGQLGNSSNINRSSPVLVSSTNVFTKLASRNGRNNSSAIDQAGLMFVWGKNVSYATYSSVVDSSSPIQIGSFGRNIRFSNITNPVYTVNSEQGEGSWLQVSAGNKFSFGIKNNLLYGWGVNNLGQTGTNQNIETVFSPTQIGTNSWINVSASEIGNFAGGITSDNKLVMWGNGVVQTGIQYSSSNTSWAQISTGSSHSVGIRQDGTLWAWGGNSVGQLGDGTTINRSSPVQIGTSSWIQVATGYGFSFAIRTDGTLWSWGINDSGVLGITFLGGSGSRSSPVQIGTSTWAHIASGWYTAYGILSNGELYAWGNNGIGQLGVATAASGSNRSSPTLIPSSVSWKFVTSSGRVAAAIKADDTLWTWGWGSSGALGNGASSTTNSPVQVTGAWRDITCFGVPGPAEDFLTGMVGLRTDSTLWSWGGWANGAGGRPTQSTPNSPVQVVGANSYTSISSGLSGCVFAIDTVSRLWVWGDNSSGQLGFGDIVARSSPTLLNAAAGRSWIYTMNNSSATTGSAVDSSNNLYLWGNNAFGQLGTGDTINRSSPVQVSGNWVQTYPIYSYGFLLPALPAFTSSPVQIGNDNWNQLNVGASHSLAIRNNGTLWSWGINIAGALGLGDTVTRSSPTLVSSASWLQVSAGTDHSMAIRSDNTLWGWGNPTLGQIGRLTDLYSWSMVSMGNGHTAAIRSDGLLFTWGNNNVGQLGVNDIADRSSPVQVGSEVWSSISAGASHTIAIRNNILYGWGWNTGGQLGVNDIINRSSPVVVSGGLNFNKIAAGYAHTAGITTDNKLYAWGFNGYGTFGTNDTTTRSNPTLAFTSLTSVSSYTQVATGTYTIFAIANTGILYGSGSNQNGELGDNTTIRRSSPVTLAGSFGTSVFTQISSNGIFRGVGGLGGFDMSAALASNSTLTVWGYNQFGQLGDNTTISKSSPVTISGSWASVIGGRFNTIGIRTDGTLWAWGLNNLRQLGDSTNINRSSPVQIGSQSWTIISNASNSTAGFAGISNGLLYMWGSGNGSGQFGLSDVISRSSPTLVGNNIEINTLSPVQIPGSYVQVSAGNQFTLARDINNNIYAWGQDSSGQLGL